MTDRELLERAAKAIGWDVEYWAQEDYPVCIQDETKCGFNPLKFDSDALRIAVKLRINIEHGQYSVRAWTDDDAPVMVDETVFTPDESQRQFAMREAITRAAAAIHDAKGQ